MKWYEDLNLTGNLPMRYRLYAVYSRLAGSKSTRSVAGGSFLLRALRKINRWLGLESVIPIRGIDGLVVYADFNDERILEVIHEIRGENAEYRVMRELLSPGATFIDVGANFGTFSLLAANISGPAGRVIAIEPQPRLADLIRRSAEASGLSNIEVLNVACGSKAGSVTLLVPVGDSGRAGIHSAFSGKFAHESMSVPTIQLDQVVASADRHENVVIKIDVEGSEGAVLDGSQLLINELRPPLIVEINPWSAQAAGERPEALLLRLQSLGYRSFATMQSFPSNVDVQAIDVNSQSNIVARF